MSWATISVTVGWCVVGAWRGAGTLRPAGPAPGLGPVTAEQILAERFARGEIDEDEFWPRMTTLRAGRPDDHSAATAR